MFAHFDLLEGRCNLSANPRCHSSLAYHMG
jgi:hypothetical protein